MGPAVLTRGALIVNESVRARAGELVEEAGDERIDGLFIATVTGKQIHLAKELADFVDHLLRRVAQGGSVSVVTLPEMLTTSTAADVLGISRPTLMKMINNGTIHSTKVGSHHRLRFSDVEALRCQREQDRHSSFEEMRDIDNELDG